MKKRKWSVTMLMEGRENFAEEVQVSAYNSENAGLAAFKKMLEKYQGKGYRYTVASVNAIQS